MTTAAEVSASGNPATDQPLPNHQQMHTQHGRAVFDPREVATLVMARMNLVNTRKDELTIAIKGVTDITQQLARAYAEQLKTIEQLTRRVRALEAAASIRSALGGEEATPSAAAHGQRQQ